MSQIPGTARKVRAVLDWTASLPFRRDISEVGSIGHPEPLEQGIYEHGGVTGRSPAPRTSLVSLGGDREGGVHAEGLVLG